MIVLTSLMNNIFYIAYFLRASSFCLLFIFIKQNITKFEIKKRLKIFPIIAIKKIETNNRALKKICKKKLILKVLFALFV